MNIKKIEYFDIDYTTDLLDRLRGRVFYLTTREAFEHIRKSGAILHNRDKRFPVNAGSEMSFGRTRGWVCLFDLRNRDHKTVRETLRKYDFLGPSWFCTQTTVFSEWNLAYLFLDKEGRSRFVPNETAQEKEPHGHHVPETKVGFPGSIPLDFIEEALQVRIRIEAPKDNTWARALHLSAVKEEERLKGG